MRKYIVGALFGAALAFSMTAYADDLSQIGNKVQGEYAVIVDGSVLSQKAIGVDGSSYAPLRVIGDATGYNVSFENKTVILKKKEEPPTVDSTSQGQTAQKKISELTKEYGELTREQNSLMVSNPNGLNEEQSERYKELRDKRIDLQKQIDALKAQGEQ